MALAIDANRKKDLRRSFRRTGMVLSAVACILVCAVLSSISATSRYQLRSEAQVSELLSSSILLGKLIATDISKDNRLGVNGSLASMQSNETIMHAHVYVTANGNKYEFLESYNKAGQATIASKHNEIRAFQPLSVTSDLIEIVQPLQLNNVKLGYLYIQAMRCSLLECEGRHIGLLLFLSIIFAATVTFTTHLYLNYMHREVDNISDAIKRIGQSNSVQSDYISTISEFAELEQSINVISARLKEMELEQEDTKEKYSTLNSELEKIIHERTEALKDANQELIKTLEKLHQFQQQLVQNEKMGALGDMVAGIAHEVNTPIGLCITSSSMMMDKVETIKRDFAAKTLKASAMEQFIDDSTENLNIIGRNLERAAELISSFKQLAVAQNNESERSINLSRLINDVLISLRPRLNNTEHNILVECDEDIEVYTQAGALHQILINLIINSLMHGFESDTGGEMKITCEYSDSSTLRFVYKDNGKGIPDEIRERIFDPFVTTGRAKGGTGLGMHLVYNLVTQTLGGTITVTSGQNQGAEFVIVFPINQQKLRS